MENFTYHNPTKIVFGKNQISELKNLINSQYKILFLYGGGSIKSNGIYDQVIKILSDYKVVEFPGIEPNPEYDTCMQAIKVIKENDLDFILAVGGGSVIDAAKFIAAGVLYANDPWEIIDQRISITNALPIGTVLTIPATGSEMNGGSVISRSSLNKKRGFMSDAVFPKFSVLDPTVTYSLPSRQVANGVVDAFVHVMEQYLTFNQNAPLQDRFAESILMTLLEEGEKVLNNPKDYDVRANIMWCATMALNTLIGRGVKHDWSTHMIGHELTVVYGLDHAQTLAIILPSIMKYKMNEKADKIIQYAERVLKVDSSLPDNKKILYAIERTKTFFQKMGNKTCLSDYNVDINKISDVIQQLEKNGMIALGENENITIADSKKIIKMSI